MEQLKPCPFCGGEAEVTECEHQTEIECKKCDFAFVAIKGTQEAITAWNTRAERTCEVAEYPTGESGTACFSCGSCHYGWHISIYDKPFTYCPNCGAKVVR